MRIADLPRTRAQLLVIVLGAGIAIAIAPFVPGLLGAAILFVVFAPAHRRARRRLAPGLSAGIAVLGAAAVVMVPGAMLVALVIDRAPGMLVDLQESALLTRLAALRVAEIDVGAQIASASGAVLSWLSRQGLAVVGTVVHATVNLTIALFGLYYLLLAPPAAWDGVTKLLPFSPVRARRLGARFRSVTEAMLLGVVLTAVLQGSVVGVAFWLVGLPEALFWGIVTAFVSVLPLFGSAIVWLPGVVVLAGTGRYAEAFWLAVLGAGVASNIDNLTRPMMYRRISHIHPMTTVVGAFAGVALFGIVGVLIGPLAISYFFELLHMYLEEYGGSTSTTVPQVMAVANGATPGGVHDEDGLQRVATGSPAAR